MRIKATDSTLLIVDIQERLFPVILDAAAMAEHTAWLHDSALLEWPSQELGAFLA